MPTLKSVKSLCYRVLRGAPLTPRTRHRSPFPFTELFHRDYSALFIRFVSQPRSPQPSSVLVFSSVLRPRLLNHSPSSSPEPSSVLVSGTILHPRPRNCPSSSSHEPFSVPSPLPSFILVSGTVLHSRFQPCSPDSSPEPSFILVSGTVLHPRLQNRPPSRLRYRPPSSSPSPFSIHVFSRPVFLDVTKKGAKKRYL